MQTKNDQIILGIDGSLLLVLKREIDWMESEGNFVVFHCDGETYSLKTSISRLEKELDKKKFIRIHRCTIVNVDRICSIEPSYYGNYQVVLTDGTKHTLTRKDKLIPLKDALLIGDRPA